MTALLVALLAAAGGFLAGALAGALVMRRREVVRLRRRRHARRVALALARPTGAQTEDAPRPTLGLRLVAGPSDQQAQQ